MRPDQRTAGALETNLAFEADFLARRRPSLARRLARALRSKPLGAIGLFAAGSVLLLAALAPVIAPQGYEEQDLFARLDGPSLDHPLGTDSVGSDVLAQAAYGARVSLRIGVISSAVAIVLATAIGAISGYLGGWVDISVQRFVDAWLALPYLVILLSISAILGSSETNVIIALSLGFTFGTSRVIRSSVMAVRGHPFIDAATVIGCGHARILLRHVLPNVLAPIMVLATLTIGNAILAEASLSFLGLGVPPPAPSWGRMLSGQARVYMIDAPWLALVPGIAISVTIFGFNMFGDALRDWLDPRLRGR